MHPDENTAQAADIAAIRRLVRRRGRFAALRTNVAGLWNRVPVSKLGGRQWAWLHFKAALVVWAGVVVFLTPVTNPSAAAAYVRWAWFASVVLGAVVASIGLVMSTRDAELTRKRGVRVELIGLWFLLGCPAAVFLARGARALGLAPPGEDSQAVSAMIACLAYVAAAAIIGRIAVILPAYRRNLADSTTAKERRDAAAADPRE